MEKMYQVLFTEEEYNMLLSEYSRTAIMELSDCHCIDREEKDVWDHYRIDYNTLVALRRAEQVEVDFDLYEH